MAGAEGHLYILAINPNILIKDAAFELDLNLNQAFITPLLHCGTLWSYYVCVCVCVYLLHYTCVYG